MRWNWLFGRMYSSMFLPMLPNTFELRA